uniref:DUF5698 domain-containing protein n=1 Tax=Roseihalotalea indica TaxID=2867963 RepID=A0AA49GJI1_9BACT|nr:DUF5698 domain-containing protein [Tunicatimonas sp. TK19036]
MIDFDIISYILLPVLIFLARVADVTVATVKLMFVVNNARRMAAILGFIEAFITIVALSRIIQDASNMPAFFMYAAGFATGTYAGMWIEEKMAYGSVLVRIISKNIPSALFTYLIEKQFRYSMVDANDQSGNTQVLFTVCKRNRLGTLLSNLEKIAPEALYTIEGVKQVSHELLPEQQKKAPLSLRLKTVISSWGRRTQAAFYHW